MPAYVGLDVSQREATGCFLLADGREPEPRWTMANTQLGAGEPILHLSSLAQRHGVDELRIGMKATGLYWWHLACALKDAPSLQPYGAKVYALNPKPVHDFREAYGPFAEDRSGGRVRDRCLPSTASVLLPVRLVAATIASAS